MSYTGISVREALEKINAENSGWYLPQVQRQYVWGARHGSEDYVCLLFDSLMKGYPIGGVVLWETKEKVPYRRFLGDYEPGQFAHQVDEGLWGASKALVYDGQQRLQTIYSVLRHSFNSRVLHYDLLFDPAEHEADETGFFFRDATATPELQYLRMSELSSTRCDPAEKVKLEDRYDILAKGDPTVKLRIRTNLGALWRIFAETSVNSVAYFSVRADTPKDVNEVFRRLNTGGVALTQLELVLGKIKEVQSDYEEKLWEVSETIANKSGGIQFSSVAVLQFFHFLVKKTIRIDESLLKTGDISGFRQVLESDTLPLVELFSGYFNRLFNINHASIIPRWLAVLPIAAYLTERRRNGQKWRILEIGATELQFVHKYFLLSQFCDWNTQTMVNAFAREAMTAGATGQPFPLEKIREIAVEKNRTPDLREYQLLSQPWFAAKVLMPTRSYVFHESKPQVDHVFPINLSGRDEAYRQAVDVLWNFQPVPAEVNNYKRARHPREFFQSDDGGKYWSVYDFIPTPKDVLWNDHIAFLKDRREKMLDALNTRYGMKVEAAT